MNVPRIKAICTRLNVTHPAQNVPAWWKTIGFRLAMKEWGDTAPDGSSWTSGWKQTEYQVTITDSDAVISFTGRGSRVDEACFDALEDMLGLRV